MLPFTLSAELSVLWLLHLGARISSWPVSQYLVYQPFVTMRGKRESLLFLIPCQKEENVIVFTRAFPLFHCRTSIQHFVVSQQKSILYAFNFVFQFYKLKIHETCFRTAFKKWPIFFFFKQSSQQIITGNGNGFLQV